MEMDYQKIKGVVDEVALERDGQRFNAFNVTISMIVNSGKPLTFNQGDQLISQYGKELLGKAVELSAVIVSCPICGKGFNSEQGMKQHMRMTHEKRKKTKAKKKTTRKKVTAKK
jgi:uncharacterized C2H2 Zn-finger protein